MTKELDDALSSPDLLLGQSAVVRQGELNAESSSMFTGKITGFGRDRRGKPISIILDDGAQVIPYDKAITTISLITDP